MSELLEQRIEAAAQALADYGWNDPYGGPPPPPHDGEREMARAAILASDAVLAQAGMVVVPREATEEMLIIGEGLSDLVQPRSCGPNTPESRRDEFRYSYTAMIDAFAAPDNGGGESDG